MLFYNYCCFLLLTEICCKQKIKEGIYVCMSSLLYFVNERDEFRRGGGWTRFGHDL
jgi:peptide methionine sulfoxide reductase MsrB